MKDLKNLENSMDGKNINPNINKLGVLIPDKATERRLCLRKRGLNTT